MRNIIVTGSKGQLGSEIKDRISQLNGFNFIFTDVEELDITNKEAVDRLFKVQNPAYIINCAAYTAVDKAEDEPELAYKINRDAVEFLALASKNCGARMFHISTDYVFDGTNHKPYTEEDKPNPVSVYGKSKYEGELAVQKHLSDAYIIRTSWVYSAYGNNFVKTILRLAKEREELNVIMDQVGTPTYAGDLAEAILTIIGKIETQEVDVPGLYHYSNEGVTSWYDFALDIIMKKDINCNIKAIPAILFPTRAARPYYSVLYKSKVNKLLKLEVPHWRASLKNVLQKSLL